MHRFYTLLLATILSTHIYSQQAYFVDGYHGGIYGHYPVKWKTQFIVDQLATHPDWRICLEIEPETWDTVQVQTPEAYRRFANVATGSQVEFTNPTYAQPYCYNISGESLIRQFQYGIAKIRKHFPEVDFTTYSVEEPCFTSCLPQILRMFGFKYAVLKCPDTCWGGYTAAHGGELVNWVGTDGTRILAVPRYACEELEQNSTWQTTAWNNSTAYLTACRNAGIEHPVGMCFQDAGWRNGPWLGSGEKVKNHSIYIRWKDYFEKVSAGKCNDDWHFSQEDVRVNLMWGSEVLRRIAQQVRKAENRLVMAEKLSAMACLANGYRCSEAEIDEGWRTLMLAQHHDSWIVPYNRLKGYGTWADAIEQWTDSSVAVADRLMQAAAQSFPKDKGTEQTLRVFNTMGTARTEVVSVWLPRAQTDVEVLDWKKQRVVCAAEKEGKGIRLLFEAKVPSFGYSTYLVRQAKPTPISASQPTDEAVVENEQYRLVFDLTRGGVLKSLVAKKEGNKEFAASSGEYALGELRGYFYEEKKFHSSTEAPAKLVVLRKNSLETQVKIEGRIASHPFTQVVTLRRGAKCIDFDLTIDWQHNVGIGEYAEKNWQSNRRAYCDDRFKLSVLFPVALQSPRVYKDAPFDVCESRLNDTFFGAWSDIKHNVILHWVDVAEQTGNHALALLTDHTTSYSFGQDYPLGLTAQYSGVGLWGRNYRITRPLQMHYALLPHRGKWDTASVSAASDAWNEPLQCFCQPSARLESKSFADLQGSGYRLSAARMENGKVMLRLFNAEGNGNPCKVKLKTEITVAMPRFGIKTLRL